VERRNARPAVAGKRPARTRPHRHGPSRGDRATLRSDPGLARARVRARGSGGRSGRPGAGPDRHDRHEGVGTPRPGTSAITASSTTQARLPHSPRSQRLPGYGAIRLRRPVHGCGSACGSRDEPKAAPPGRRQHGFGITQLPPQFLVLQRHRDTLGVIDRSALIGGDREPRHSRKRTHSRRSCAGGGPGPSRYVRREGVGSMPSYGRTSSGQCDEFAVGFWSEFFDTR